MAMKCFVPRAVVRSHYNHARIRSLAGRESQHCAEFASITGMPGLFIHTNGCLKLGDRRRFGSEERVGRASMAPQTHVDIVIPASVVRCAVLRAVCAAAGPLRVPIAPVEVASSPLVLRWLWFPLSSYRGTAWWCNSPIAILLNTRYGGMSLVRPRAKQLMQ